MVKIFFFSPAGFAPMKDETIRNLCNTHGWQADGQTWVYGVAIPKPGIDPNEVADYLTSKGVLVVPGVHDQSTPVHPQIVTALATFGVTPADKGVHVAQKLAAASGSSVLRPHLF